MMLGFRAANRIGVRFVGISGGHVDVPDTSSGLQQIINSEANGLFLVFTSQTATIKDAAVTDRLAAEPEYLAIDFVYRPGAFAEIREA